MQPILIQRQNIPYYLLIAGSFIITKFVYTHLTTDDLQLFLLPLDKIITLFSGAGSEYLPEQGYFYSSLNILIDKSCSGMNFFLLCFMMLSFMTVQHLSHWRYKFYALMVCALVAYLSAMFVNSARILTSIMLQQLDVSGSYVATALSHQAEGVFIYLLFLILIYAIYQIILSRKVNHHA